MRRSFALPSALALVPLLVACPPGDESGGTGQRAAPDTVTATQTTLPGQQAASDTIIITMDQTGNVSVSEDELRLVRGRAPVVLWESNPPGGHWIVGFGAQTPFQGGKRVFFGGSQSAGDRRGTIPTQANLGEYKYWVFFADAQGNYNSLDPKLVIIDDPGALSDTTDAQD